MPPKIDRYTRARLFLDLVDQANGLPAGTTKVGTLQTEDYKRMAEEMARTIVVLQWGLTGCIGAMIAENEELTGNNYRKQMPFYNFDWGTYYNISRQVQTMHECGCKPDLLTQVAVVHDVFHENRRLVQVPDEKKKLIWEIVVAENWHTSLVKRIMKDLQDAYLHAPDRVEEIAKICIAAARRIRQHGNRRDFSDIEGLAIEHVSGEGLDTPSGSA